MGRTLPLSFILWLFGSGESIALLVLREKRTYRKKFIAKTSSLFKTSPYLFRDTIYFYTFLFLSFLVPYSESHKQMSIHIATRALYLQKRNLDILGKKSADMKGLSKAFNSISLWRVNEAPLDRLGSSVMLYKELSCDVRRGVRLRGLTYYLGWKLYAKVRKLWIHW